MAHLPSSPNTHTEHQHELITCIRFTHVRARSSFRHWQGVRPDAFEARPGGALAPRRRSQKGSPNRGHGSGGPSKIRGRSKGNSAKILVAICSSNRSISRFRAFNGDSSQVPLTGAKDRRLGASLLWVAWQERHPAFLAVLLVVPLFATPSRFFIQLGSKSERELDGHRGVFGKRPVHSQESFPGFFNSDKRQITQSPPV